MNETQRNLIGSIIFLSLTMLLISAMPFIATIRILLSK
jgi:hypothetical protein